VSTAGTATGPDNLPHERVEYAIWFWVPSQQVGELVVQRNREAADQWLGGTEQTADLEITLMERTVKVGPWVSTR
jgi:hypothetical protein